MSNIAEQMAAYAEQLKFEHLKPETVKEVKRRLLDSIACSLGANGNTPPEIAKRIAGAVNCEPGSNVIGTGHASSPDMATSPT